MFLSVGESFTAELTDVKLLGPVFGSPPRLLLEASSATVNVPEEAASSEVHLWRCGGVCEGGGAEYYELMHDLSTGVEFHSSLFPQQDTENINQCVCVWTDPSVALMLFSLMVIYSF